MKLLVLNCGSSSIKHRLFDMPSETEHCAGAVEGIGSESSTAWIQTAGGEKVRSEQPIADHAAAVAIACEQLVATGLLGVDGPDLVAHRVVHGGESFSEAVVIDEAVIAAIERLVPLAPLHNPANLLGIRLLRDRFGSATHVAAFDTAFHRTLPEYASAYAIPRGLAREHGVRRYGFHGASHRWASQRAAELLGRPTEGMRTVVLHLGAGASASAVLGGRSIDTSMGMTPLEGLVMATRSGDLDPGVVLYLQRKAGLTAEAVDRLLNRESGLAGLAGSSDLRAVLERAGTGDKEARLAVDAYVYRIAKQVGAYAVALGGLDTLVFTAGVGERSAVIRAAVAERLGVFGVELDTAANAADSADDRSIQTSGSRVAVLVVGANEELQIARDAVVAVASGI